MSKWIAGAIVAKDPHTFEVIFRFRCAFDAQKEGYDPSCIAKCIYGKRLTHKGLKWEREN
jgi:hypothetical protein